MTQINNSRMEKPSVMEHEMFCDTCGNKEIIFMTNTDYWNKNNVTMMCKVCKAIRSFTVGNYI